MNKEVSGKTLWVAEEVPVAKEKIDYFLEEAGRLRSQIDNKRLPQGQEYSRELLRAKRFAREANEFLSEAVKTIQPREDLPVLQRRLVSFEGYSAQLVEGNGPIGFYHFVAETLNRHVPFLRALRDHLQENDSGKNAEARASVGAEASATQESGWKATFIGGGVARLQGA